jgi:hypothetical protein
MFDQEERDPLDGDRAKSEKKKGPGANSGTRPGTLSLPLGSGAEGYIAQDAVRRSFAETRS